MKETKGYWHENLNINEIIAEVVREKKAKNPNFKILEVGGGRNPRFFNEDIISFNNYFVNDIDPNELALLDERFNSSNFDIAGDIIPKEMENQFDVIISVYVAEHVKDGYKMHQNVYKLLNDTGTAVHLFPKLYALPFVVNYLLPERASHFVLNLLAKRDLPKFPALYSYCRGNETKMRSLFEKINYQTIDLQFYYGTSYFKNLPFLYRIDNWINKWLMKKHYSTLSSYLVTKLSKN
jgi:SAM-dependent methyltransferase